MSSRAGPIRVSRPRRSSASTSKGSTASSTGTDDGARMGAAAVILSECESMALYLGSVDGNRKGLWRPKQVSSLRTQGPITTGIRCYERYLPHRENERSRGMGPCVRRDDISLGFAAYATA